MKHLKIEGKVASFERDGSWVVVTEMTKDDLLKLAQVAVDEQDFEIDPFDESQIPNPAQRIIYKQISDQLVDLHRRRDTFQEEAKNLYKDAYNKYCVE